MKDYKKVPKPIFCKLLYCPNDCRHNKNGLCKKAPNDQRFTLVVCPEYKSDEFKEVELGELIKTNDGKIWLYDDEHCEWIQVGPLNEKLKKLLKESVPIR